VRHSFSFLVTVLIDDDDPQTWRGRLRAIAAERHQSFADASELLRAIQVEVTAGLAAGVARPPDGAGPPVGPAPLHPASPDPPAESMPAPPG
jgi:hypothetical protein